MVSIEATKGDTHTPKKKSNGYCTFLFYLCNVFTQSREFQYQAVPLFTPNIKQISSMSLKEDYFIWNIEK